MRKIILYLSSFLPVLFILWIRDTLVMLDDYGKKFFDTTEFIFLLVWITAITLIFLTFLLMLHNDKSVSGNNYKVDKVENKTAEYYLQYFSFFILSFTGITLTYWIDIVVLLALLSLLGIVYIRNDLYYINPTISIINSHIYQLKVTADNKTKNITVISKTKIYSGDLIQVKATVSNICLAEVKKEYNGSKITSINTHDHTETSIP